MTEPPKNYTAYVERDPVGSYRRGQIDSSRQLFSGADAEKEHDTLAAAVHSSFTPVTM